MKVFSSISPRRLAAVLEGFPRVRVAVLGDFFLDAYLEVEPALVETSVETGKPAHQVIRRRSSPGAAGTVVNNLAALGAGRIEALGILGDDGEGYDLRKGLEAVGCGTEHLRVDPSRVTPTYLKPRDVHDPSLAGEHSRYDTKNRTPAPPESIGRVLQSLDALLGELDAVIVADQVEEAECGVVTAAVRAALAERAGRSPQVVFWADSRRRIRDFRGMTIKPNQFEAVGWESPPPDARVPLAEIAAALVPLRAAVGAAVCVTLGERGMLVSDPEPVHVPAMPVEGPIDPTGAGDSATAAAVLALAAGAELAEAAFVGNLAASVTIRQLGTTGTAAPEQLLAVLEDSARLDAGRRHSRG